MNTSTSIFLNAKKESKVHDLTVTGTELLKFAIHPDAFVLRENALKYAANFKKVTSAASRELAFDALKGLKAVSTGMETARKREKGAIDKIVKNEIQTPCADFQEPILPEIKRLEEELGAFDLKLREEAEEADRLRQVELNRLEEEKRKADEAIRLAAISGDASELAKALEAKSELKNDILVQSIPIKSDKLSGGALRQDWEVEITDESALKASRPDLFDMIPSMTRIKAALESGSVLSGVSAKKVAKLGVRYER